MLKYLPTTAAIDSCSCNYCTTSESPEGAKAEGRAQLEVEEDAAYRLCLAIDALLALGESAREVAHMLELSNALAAVRLGANAAPKLRFISPGEAPSRVAGARGD